MKILNLYAGLGGNRKHWEGEITAVENQSDIAFAYQDQYPDDQVVIADAHQYLIENHSRFDFIWSSPPCQSHSKMNRTGNRKVPMYPDFRLYEEIWFLQNHFKGDWVVENVIPYYTPLITPTSRVGRHLFWSNKPIKARDVETPENFISIGKGQATPAVLKEWLGIDIGKNIYYSGGHCPAQVLRNCVHPEIGKQVFESIRDFR